MMVSGISIHLIGLADTVFLARLGEVELGAGGNSTLLYFTIALSLSGLSLASQIIIGRRNGEGNFSEIGHVLRQNAVFLLLLTFMAWAALFFFTNPLVNAIYSSPGIVSATGSFMHTRVWGLFPALANFQFIAFYVGITKTRPLAIVTPMMALINIVLDYALIFGKGPFPEMGIEGAALASVISESFGTCFFLVYTLLFVDLKKFGLDKKFRFDAGVIQRIWKLGSPLMTQSFIAMTSWFIFFAIVEHLGERPLAVSHIIRSLYLIMAIPLTSWADATNTLVSNLIGRARTDMIIPTIKKIALLLFAVDLVYVILLNLVPSRIIGLFTSNLSLVDDTIPSLRVISFSTILFSLSLLVFRALTGAGLTRLSLFIEIAAVLVYLLMGGVMVTWFAPSTAEIWCTEFAYFTILGGCSLYFLRKGVYHTRGV